MNNYLSTVIFLSLCAINNVKSEFKAAEATLQTGTINGTVYFTETELGVQVTGVITGLPAGLYGFHVHEIGDVTTCDAAGPHFNPVGNNHGGRDHLVRHVGDLGNVEFVGTGNSAIATFSFLDNVIALNGTNNIMGRTLVLHEQADDLGLGGHETSLTTGNAGARVACGIIRDIGNSVMSITPSIIMVILNIMTFMYFSL